MEDHCAQALLVWERFSQTFRGECWCGGVEDHCAQVLLVWERFSQTLRDECSGGGMEDHCAQVLLVWERFSQTLRDECSGGGMEDYCAQALLVWERFKYSEMNAGVVVWMITVHRLCSYRNGSNTQRCLLWWCMEDHYAQALLVWKRFKHSEVNAGMVVGRITVHCSYGNGTQR